jgi:hypothetical protein
MRHSGDWMTLVDDRILELLTSTETLSPSEIEDRKEINYSKSYVARRCRKLAENGLLKPLGNGIYRITEDGRLYLNGRLDTHNWIYLDEEGNPEGQAVDEPDGPSEPSIGEGA